MAMERPILSVSETSRDVKLPARKKAEQYYKNNPEDFFANIKKSSATLGPTIYILHVTWFIFFKEAYVLFHQVLKQHVTNSLV